MKRYSLYSIIGGEKKNIKEVPKLNKIINKQNFHETEYQSYCRNYPYTHAIMPAQPKIVVLGDIHGDYELAINMLKLGKLIDNNNNWIGGSTYVVQVGDQIDRCRPINNMTCDKKQTTYDDESSDVKILKLFTNLDLQAIKQGGRVISLFGNHEIMNIQGQLNYVSYEGLKEFENYKDPNNPTRKFISPIHARAHAFAPGNELGRMLGCTRLPAVIIGQNLFVHAGIINSIVKLLGIHSNSDLETINIAMRKWLLGLLDSRYLENIIKASKKSIFWTRILGSLPSNIKYDDKRCVDNLGKVLSTLRIGKIVIGHTPTSFAYNDDTNSTCSGSVLRTDNGSSKAFNKFDNDFLTTGKVNDKRRAQIAIITNDNQVSIVKM